LYHPLHHLVFPILNAFNSNIRRTYVTLFTRKCMYHSVCYAHQTYPQGCVVAREILRVPSIAGTLQITLFTTVNGHLSSSRKINFGAQKWVYRARSTWTDVIVPLLRERKIRCRARIGDTTVLIFYSAPLYIVVSYDIVYRLGNGAVKISKLLTSLPAPFLLRTRDGRFKIIKRHK
jgi:hypothetical protein